MTMTLVPVRTDAVTFAVTIPDIHCCECAWVLQLGLEALKGIVHADVDCDEATATITFRPADISSDTIVQAIESIGYKVKPLGRNAA